MPSAPAAPFGGCPRQGRWLLRSFSREKLDHDCGRSLHVVVAATDFGPERVKDVESGLLSFKRRQQAVHALAQQPGLLEAAQVHNGVCQGFARLEKNSAARLETQFIQSPRQCLAEVLENQYFLVLDRPEPAFGYPRPLTTAEKVPAVRRAFKPRCRCSCFFGGPVVVTSAHVVELNGGRSVKWLESCDGRYAQPSRQTPGRRHMLLNEVHVEPAM